MLETHQVYFLLTDIQECLRYLIHTTSTFVSLRCEVRAKIRLRSTNGRVAILACVAVLYLAYLPIFTRNKYTFAGDHFVHFLITLFVLFLTVVCQEAIV
jgi:hypothetical protein